MMFMTVTKNSVGDRSGTVIVQKRLKGLAPSIAAASMRDLGIA